MTDAEDQGQTPLGAADIWMLIGGAFGLYLALSSIGPDLDGPAYLGVFVLIWAGLMAGQVTLRHAWRDSFAVSGAAAAVLAGLAISRYSWGVQRGMERWTFLAIMAVLGCASFFIRTGSPSADDADTSSTRSDGRSSRSSWWSRNSSSCGSGGGGCGGGGDGGGGGGCGGGGCGGCGG